MKLGLWASNLYLLSVVTSKRDEVTLNCALAGRIVADWEAEKAAAAAAEKLATRMPSPPRADLEAESPSHAAAAAASMLDEIVRWRRRLPWTRLSMSHLLLLRLLLLRKAGARARRLHGRVCALCCRHYIFHRLLLLLWWSFAASSSRRATRG